MHTLMRNKDRYEVGYWDEGSWIAVFKNLTTYEALMLCNTLNGGDGHMSRIELLVERIEHKSP